MVKLGSRIGIGTVFLALATVVAAGACSAEDAETVAQAAEGAAAGDGGAAHGGRHAPPQAAIDACSGKAAGDACTLTAPDGMTFDSTCGNGPDGSGVLACAPPRRGPPQAAIDACSGKAAGDACTLTAPDGMTFDSTCGTCGDGDTLACAPPDRPRR